MCAALVLAWIVLCFGLGSALAQPVATGDPRLGTTELAMETASQATLTVTHAWPVAEARTYPVTSSRPDVVRVPDSVSLPAGTTSVAVPLQALAPGISLVTLQVDGRQLAATVRVVEGNASLTAITPQPAAVVQRGSTRLHVEMSATLRADVTVELGAVPADALSLPQQITIPAGSRSAAVSVRGMRPGTHVVRAVRGRERIDASLRVTPAAPAVLALEPARSGIEVGASSQLTVRLTGPATTALDVALAADPAELIQLPPSVRVPAGEDRASVAFSATAPGTTRVTAEGGGRLAEADVVVRSPAGAAAVPVVTVRPPGLSLAVGATTGVSVELDAVRSYDVELTVRARPPQSLGGGAVVALPATIVIPAGSRSATLEIGGLAPGGMRVQFVTAGGSVVGALEVAVVDQPSTIRGITVSPQPLPKGAVGEAVVTVDPVTGAPRELAVNVEPQGIVAAPATITVAPGKTQATVPLAARAEGEAEVRAQIGNSSVSARVVVAPPAIEELRPPATTSLRVGTATPLMVQALRTDGTLVTNPTGLQITSDRPEIVGVQAGNTLVGVAVGTAQVQVRLGVLIRRIAVTVLAQPALQLTPANAEVAVGGSVTYTVTTTSAPPSGGLRIALGVSGQGAVELPATITIPRGSMTATFAARALEAGTVTLRAEADGRTPATAVLVKKAQGLAIDAIAPQRGPAGTAVTITGVGFDPLPSRNTVLIGNIALEVVSASAAQIVARVPVTAVTGAVRVTNALGTATGPTFTVDQTQDASLSVSPDSVRLLRGSEATASLVLVNQGTQPYTGSMSLSVTGLPAGITATFDPQVLPAERNGTLRLQAASTVAPGTYKATVSAAGFTTAGSVTRSSQVTITVPDPAVTPSTGVRGRFVTPAGLPIAGVIVRADSGGNNSPTTTTDASGAFELAGLAAGPVTLRFDATPANPLYPIWPYSATLVADQMIVLKDFVIAPPPVAQSFTPINNAAQDQRVTDARFPGLEVVLPAGTEIVGYDGVRKTQIAVEKREISELPVPPPPVPTGTAYQLYFGTPMGGIPSRPIPVTLPNDTGAGPGETVNVWYFDGAPLGGTGEWRIAGQAVVSADGRVARMVSGGLTRFCGVCGLACLEAPPKGPDPGVGDTPAAPDPEPTVAPAASPACAPGDCTCQGNQPAEANPVNLFSGQQLATAGGLACGGRVPLNMSRAYNPIDAFNNIGGTEGSIGYGWTSGYDVVFLPGPTKRLILPGNVQRIFLDTGSGTWTNVDDPMLAGAIAQEVSGGWQIRFRGGQTWRFQPFAGAPGNVRGQPQFLVESTDPGGRVLTVARSSRGQLQSVGTNERRITASYGSSGFIETLSDPEGRTERYTYTGTKRLETVTDPDGRITRYAYVRDQDLPMDQACVAAFPADLGERLKTITYPGLANPTENYYGSSRRVLRQTTATGQEFQFSYRIGGACITHTSAPGVRCTGPTCPSEDNWETFQAGWRFHGGQVLSTTVRRPDGTTRTTRFGSQGQVLEDATSSGWRRTVLRDAANRPVLSTDSVERRGRNTYDDAGRLVRHADTLGRITDYSYDPQWSKPASITRYADDGTPQTWSFTYDTRGNVATATDPLGNRTRFAYDNLGQLTTVTNALDHSTRFGYTAAGDLSKVTDPLQNDTLLGTDRTGRTTVTTDALGYSTTVRTNGIGQTTQVEDAIGGRTLLSYDEGARLQSVTNPRGHAVATYAYDVYGRLTARTDAAGKSDTYSYDAAGRVERVVDRKGQTTRYVHDASGRLASIEFADRVRRFTYDGAGRIVRVEEPGSRVDYEYDSVDRLVKETQTNGAVSHEIAYGYDRLDRRVWRRVDGGDETRYEWDLANRLTAIRYAGESTLYQWDAAGRLVRKTLPNGITVDHTYDAASRLLGIVYANTAGGLLEKIDYTYDARGMRTSKALAIGSVISDTPMTAVYDAADRMTSVTFTATGETCSLTYDDNGNLARKDCGAGKLTEYRWDILNRLIGLTGPGVEAAFAYDVMGRRASRTVNGTTTTFVYDGAQAVGEIVNGQRTTLLTGLAIDEAIASYASSKRRYALTDALGSVLAEVAADGAVTSGRSYSVYGESATSGEAPAMANAYTGREDDRTGLMYYRARYYDPVLKRFTQVDPIGLAGGMNSFQYVNGNVPGNSDPFGLDAMETFEWARGQVGSQSYGYYDSHPDIGGRSGLFLGGRGSWKCNVFVNDALGAGGCSPGLVDGRPPVVKEWKDPEFDIPNCPVVSSPKLGDVVAFGGHVGIYAPVFGPFLPGQEPQSTISANSEIDQVVHNNWPYKNMTPRGPVPTYRRCSCSK